MTRAARMARRTFQMIDVVEILQHWHANRPKLVLSASLGVDPKIVRKYVAPAEAVGIAPGDGLVLDRAVWGALVGVVPGADRRAGPLVDVAGAGGPPGVDPGDVGDQHAGHGASATA